MKFRTSITNAAAVAAVLALSSPTLAQQQSQGGQQGQSGQQSQSGQQTQSGQQGQSGQQTQSGQQGQVAAQQAMTPQQEQALIAKVGDAEIRGRDVMEAIGALPPQLQRQPLELLVPLAFDQLVTREMILQQARSANLQEDPEVRSLSEPVAQAAREQAMVQVWLQRELQNRVTDEKVQQLYDGLKAAQPDQAIPPLEEIRPLIEQQVRQQAIAEMRNDLRQNTDVTLYGPSGQPLQGQQGQQSQSGSQSKQ